MPQNAQLLFSIPCQNTLGEGVLFDVNQQTIWWTDIQACVLFAFSLADKQTTRYEMPGRVGSFGLTNQDNVFIVAFDSGVALYNIVTKALTWLARPERSLQGNRFNDGKVSHSGDFWVGTMVEDETIKSPEDDRGSLYQFSQSGDYRTHLSNLNISNGLAFHPNQSTFYHCDSQLHQVFQYHYDEELNKVARGQLMLETAQDVFPDGACLDSQGNLWLALWGAGKVVCLSPKAEILFELEVPVSQPTCIAFAGDNLDLLVVTSARESLSQDVLAEQPQAGDVFVYQLSGFKGKEEPRFLLAQS